MGGTLPLKESSILWRNVYETTSSPRTAGSAGGRVRRPLGFALHVCLATPPVACVNRPGVLNEHAKPFLSKKISQRASAPEMSQ